MLLLLCLVMGLIWGMLFAAGMNLAGIPMDWMDAQIRGYASALKSTELKALVLVKQMWEKEQEEKRNG